MIATWQRNADIAVRSFPSNFTSTVVWCTAFSIDTSQTIVVTDWLKAWVQFSLGVLDLRFPPARLADDISFAVANVPVGVFKVFSFAGVIVDLQLGEETESTNHVEKKRENNYFGCKHTEAFSKKLNISQQI
jgi:hypothetical protein